MSGPAAGAWSSRGRGAAGRGHAAVLRLPRPDCGLRDVAVALR